MSKVDLMVWGYHEYRSIWENSSEDDKLICENEVGILCNTHAVATKSLLPESVVQWDTSVCSVFISHSDII